MNNLEEKIQREKQKKDEEETRQRRLEATKHQVSIDYDPHQLYEPTQAWTSRSKTPRDPSAEQQRNTPASIFQVPHRAVPSWRQ